MNLQKITGELDYYKKFIPNNYNQEMNEFFRALNRGRIYNPIFKYDDKLNASDYTRIKHAIEKSRGEDRIINQFVEVYSSVADMMAARQNDIYDEITRISGELFGDYKDLDEEAAIDFYKTNKGFAYSNQHKVYSDKQLAARAFKELEKWGMLDWQVEYNGVGGSEVQIYEHEKKIVIKSGTKLPKPSIERIVCHEVVGHALQHFNGEANKKYSDWFTAYIGTEKQYEGLAVFTEIHNLEKTHIDYIFGRYVLFIIATSIAARSDFYEVYQKVYELCGDQEFSFFTAYKTKRGFRDTAKPGCFQKENSYIFGTRDIINLVQEDEDNYDKIISGLFPLSAMPLIDKPKNKWVGINMLNSDNEKYFSENIDPIFKN